ncbi:hypothetical protein GCM10028801_31490 [Nocardioides maradonensis]
MNHTRTYEDPWRTLDFRYKAGDRVIDPVSDSRGQVVDVKPSVRGGNVLVIVRWGKDSFVSTHHAGNGLVPDPADAQLVARWLSQ